LDSPAFDFAGRFQGRSRREIAQDIGPEQVRLLRQFLGSGVGGARAAADNFRIPAGLTRETLEAYHEIARRTIKAGQDYLGVQRLRLALIEKALPTMNEPPDWPHSRR
jgi:hypothetical protein